MKNLALILKNDISEDVAKLMLRIILGFTMLLHGIDKMAGGVSWLEGMMSGMGLPGFLAYGVYVGEVIAPIFILVGFKSRLAGLVFAFNMLVATLMVHSGDIFKLTDHGGWAIELLMLYMIGGLAIAFQGAGKYSISKGQGDWD